MIEMQTTRRDFLLAVIGLLSVGLSESALSAAMPGAGIPNRAIGVNCFDLFYGPLVRDPAVRSAFERMRELRVAGIPFVRFAASPFWPDEWKLLRSDRKRYFACLDAAVEAAESNTIGLVPSLFWNPSSVSDMVGESVKDWGRPGSRTLNFMAEYAEMVVSRYQKSKAVWMWEFGNEFNTYADLPNALKWWPRVRTEKGTPSDRSSHDLIRSADCKVAFQHFGMLVRKLDKWRPITNGADIPRPNAYNLAHGKIRNDTAEEFRFILRDICPDPVNVISTHIYQKSEGKYFSSKDSSYKQLLDEISAAAKQSRKYSFVGEFGIPRMSDKTREKQEFERLLNSIVSSEINWAALWVYDFQHQKADWSIQLKGDRAYQLEAVARANSLLRVS